MTIENAQVADTDSYRVIVTNAHGSITLRSSYLVVQDLRGVLGMPESTWHLFGSEWDLSGALYFGVDTQAGHDGTNSVRINCTNAPLGDRRVIRTDVTGSGVLSFWMKMNSGPVDLYVDGVFRTPIYTGADWVQSTMPIEGDGPHSVEWVARRTLDSVPVVWLDDVEFTSAAMLAPIITQQPDELEGVDTGGTLWLRVEAAASGGPFTYQWQRRVVGGAGFSNITGATEETLEIPNMQVANAGTYRVVVTNAVGSTTSQSCAVSLVNLRGAADAPASVAFRTHGNALWFSQSANSHDGVDALQFGPTDGQHYSNLEALVTGAGLMTYWLKVSGGDMEIWEDGQMTQVSDTGGAWVQRSVKLGGNYTVEIGWNLQGDQEGATGVIDQVEILPPSLLPPLITQQPDAYEAVDAGGVLWLQVEAAMGGGPYSYQWQRKTGIATVFTDMAGATGDSLELDNMQTADTGEYRVMVTNARGTITSNPCVVTLVNLKDAADAPTFTWRTHGTALWSSQTVTTHDGVDALQFGPTTGQDYSNLEATVTGEWMMTYWLRTSGGDMEVWVDGEMVTVSDTGGTWVKKTVLLIGNFTHEIGWFLRADDAGATAYIDEVEIFNGTPGIAVQGPTGANLNDGGTAVALGSAFRAVTAASYDFSGVFAGQFDELLRSSEAVVTQAGGTLNYLTSSNVVPVAETEAYYLHEPFRPTFDQSWTVEISTKVPLSLAAGLPLSPPEEGWYMEAAMAVMFTRADGTRFSLSSSLGIESDDGGPISRHYWNDYDETLSDDTSVEHDLPVGARNTTDETAILRFTFDANTKVLTAENSREILASLNLADGNEWGMTSGDQFRIATGFSSNGWAVPLAKPLSLDNFRAVFNPFSPSKTFTITNTGTGILSGLHVTKDGANASDFAIGILGARALAPGQSAAFTVYFVPSAVGARNAALHIASNVSGTQNPFDIPVTGIGVNAPEIDIQQPAGTSLTNGTANVGFGSVNTGTPKTLTFTVKNKGAGSLIGLAITKDGTDSAEFTVSNPLATTVAPNGSTTFTVKFSPSGPGARTAAIHIASNDENENPFNIALTGTGFVKPVITTEPSPQLVNVGKNASFTVAATGSGTLSYQWRKNGGAIKGANSPAMVVAAAKLTDAGTYTCVVTNTAGSDTTVEAEFGVVDNAPKLLTLVNGSTASIGLNATGKGQTFLWKKNGGDLPVDTRFTGGTTKTLTIKPLTLSDTDIYSCQVTGPGGMVTGGTTKLTVYDTAPLITPTPVVMPDAMVSAAYAFQIPVDAAPNRRPARYLASGLPVGLSADSNTGLISGKPIAFKATAYAVTLTATNGKGTSTATTTLMVSGLPPQTYGVFRGLTDRENALSSGFGGSFTATILNTGSFTGALAMGGITAYPFVGVLDAVLGGTVPSASVKIKRTAPMSDMTMTVTVDGSNGKLVGTLNDGTSPAVDVIAWRNTAPAAAFVGNYTAALEIDAALAGTDSSSNPPGDAANVAYPQGNGHATLTVGNTGAATWTGKMADGSAVTLSTTVGSAGDIPLHKMLYTNLGAVHGWIKLSADSGTPQQNGGRPLLDGVLDWNKRAQSTGTNYKSGFALHDQTVIGGRYAAPLPNLPVFGLTDPGLGHTNVKLVFTEGGLSGPAPIVSAVMAGNVSNVPLRISKTNAVTIPAATNMGGVTLLLTASTGAISGHFVLKNDPDLTDHVGPRATLSRTVNYYGLLVPRVGKGFGYFMLPQLPADGPPKTTLITSPQLSGQVLLEAGP